MLTLNEKFIIDENGNKAAAVLPYSQWKNFLVILEEYDDICAYDKAKSQRSHCSRTPNAGANLSLIMLLNTKFGKHL